MFKAKLSVLGAGSGWCIHAPRAQHTHTESLNPAKPLSTVEMCSEGTGGCRGA